MSDDILYDNDGNPIGVKVDLEDGGTAVVDSRGQVLAALDAYGTPLDPDDFEVVDEYDDYDDEDDFTEYEDDPEMNLDPDVKERIEYEMGKLEKHLGRKVTTAELSILGPRLRDQVDRFGIQHFDTLEAMRTAESEGDKMLDVDSAAGRAEYINRRLKEKDAESQPEHEPRNYDLDDSNDRHAYIQARASGQFDPEAGDSTSDTETY